MMFKECTSCMVEKPATRDHFHAQKNGRFGLTSKCKDCKNRQIKEWTELNPEKSRAQKLRWKSKNYEKYLSLKRDDQRRRRYHKSLETVDHAVWAMMLSVGCLRCGSSEDITQDHVVPLSKGGRNHISNIQPLCRPCNSSKSSSVVDYRPDGFFANEIVESDTILV
jgi:5-methylcytosine-specific restriction endonuclease McrA